MARDSLDSSYCQRLYSNRQCSIDLSLNAAAFLFGKTLTLPLNNTRPSIWLTNKP
jgi:hypothetical protein